MRLTYVVLVIPEQFPDARHKWGLHAVDTNPHKETNTMKSFTFRRLLGAGIACAALSVSAVAVAAPAGADTGTTAGATNAAAKGRHARMHLTDAQKKCLADHGITRPLRPLTKEKIEALKAAAKACDIKLPNLGHRLTDVQKKCLQDHGITRPIRPLTKEKLEALKAAAKACDIKLGRGPGGNHPRLTTDQRTCMQDHGITRPLRPLTPEKIAALKAAAQACGIQLPHRGAQAQA